MTSPATAIVMNEDDLMADDELVEDLKGVQGVLTNDSMAYDPNNVVDQFEEEAVKDDDAAIEEGALQKEEPAPPPSSVEDDQPVSWFRQLWVLLYYKNVPLMLRKPTYLMMALLSSVVFALLSWPAGRDYSATDDNVIFPDNYTDCGTVDLDYLSALEEAPANRTLTESPPKVLLSLNEAWRDGLPVAVLSLGPLCYAMVAYLWLHEELQLHMLSVLRGLGTTDSVYWTSWYIPLTILAAANALLGAAAAKTLPVHVYETTFLGGIFASLFFVELALLGASMLLAAVQGTRKRGVIWLLLLMMVAVWMPYLTLNAQSSFEITTNSISDEYANYLTTPTRLFWVNRDTTVRQQYLSFLDDDFGNMNNNITTSNINSTTCQIPLLSEQEGNFYKTPEEREQVPPDQFFLGCFASAGWGATTWTPHGTTKAGLAVWWFIPYFHFTTIWGNFCGYTAMPQTEFTSAQMSLTSGELAREALPVPPSDANARGTSLFPQGSMLQHVINYNWDAYLLQKSNCPAQNLDNNAYQFCSSLEFSQECSVVPEPSPAEGKSVGFMLAMCFSLSLAYVLMAAYWGIVCVGGAGTQPWYFFLLWRRYWCAGGRGKVATAVDPTTVQVLGAAKSYGTVHALKPVTFHMARGEVTALLGHNGAGKTTLSKLLTCEVAPTAGDITVFGHSIQSDPQTIRRWVGVCKQDDYLWPNLSAKEHLDLFAGLRGVPPLEHEATVQKWLESVDLDAVQHQYSSQFSGGMKRRLSLAMSTIGARSLIVLDEPTTGMDPVNRRFVWKHIDEIKKDRVVLLTTHAMEEADLLADMVAIMRKGELAAWGSPLELKTEHGSALQFSLMVEKANVARTEQTIRSHFEDVLQWIKIDAGEAGNITVNILKIQQSSGERGVGAATLSNFVGWLDAEESGVTEYGFSNSSLEEVFLKITEGDVEDSQNSGRGENGTVASEIDDVGVLNGETSKNLASYKPNLTVRGQVMALVWHSLIKTWTGKRSFGNWIMYGLFIISNIMISIWLAGFDLKTPYLTISVILSSLILLSICSGIYGDRAEGLFYLMRTQGLLKNSYLLGTLVYGLIVSFFYVSLLLGSMYSTPLFRVPSLCTPNYDTNDYCETKFGESPMVTVYSIQDITLLLTGFEGDSAAQVYAYPVPSGYSYVFGAGFVFALTVPGAALASASLPGNKFALMTIAMMTLMAGITPLITYALNTFVETSKDLEACYNSIVSLSVCDKGFFNATRGEDFLNCVGVLINEQQIYCTPSYTALLPQYGMFQMLSMALTSDIKFYSEPASFLDEVFLPSIAGDYCSGDTCSFPYASKLFLENFGWSVLGAFILVLIGVTIAHVFSFPTASVLYVKDMCLHVVERMSCRKRNRSDDTNSEKEELEEVQQEREAVKDIIEPLLKADGTVDGTESDVAIADHSSIVRDDLPPILMHKLRKVYPSFGRLPPKVALNSLDLHVPRGQVLGFLGKNGAGKTTALKILACAHDATSGIGLVAGYDVSCERINVFESLGNCPQFDVIWPKLTVKEHLLFFAKLKGLPRGDVQKACLNIATAVGLGTKAVYNRNAGALSGGMRRRLSIAISLIGAPSVFVLDEPTTGLDPSTRNNIWGLVNSFATDDRAIVITTHMMLEADTLCNRIAIIARGDLVVVATQQRLKDKFGSGYLLQLNLVKSTSENQAMAMAFVLKELHKEAVLQTKQAKTLHINLPRDLDLKRAFTALYTPTIRPECINQFLLSQSSLEDVFIALGD